MAQKTTVRLIDDLDGSEADENVSFGLDGKLFEIDLSKANAARLRKALTEFVAAARRQGSARTQQVPSQRRVRTTEDRDRNQAIREWARATGFSVPDRGRIPRLVLEAYDNRETVVHPQDERVTQAFTEAVSTPAKAKSNVTDLTPKLSGKVKPEPKPETMPDPQPITDGDIMVWWLATRANSNAKQVTAAMASKYRAAHPDVQLVRDQVKASNHG